MILLQCIARHVFSRTVGLAQEGKQKDEGPQPCVRQGDGDLAQGPQLHFFSARVYLCVLLRSVLDCTADLSETIFIYS